MCRISLGSSIFLILTVFQTARADELADLQVILSRPILAPRQTLTETQAFLEAWIPRMKTFQNAAEWTKEADRIRAAMLDKVIFRGEAARWRRRQARRRLARHHSGRTRLSHQEAALRGAAGHVDSGPSL
jgi:hypothetical protein